MSDKVYDLTVVSAQEEQAKWISHMWDTYNTQRAQKLAEYEELKKYIFATDTTTTSNNKLPWKNSTTLPKICQIRDNLIANYMAALFPNDKWLKWDGYGPSDSIRDKAKAITAYMENKARESDLRTSIKGALHDWVDYGNCFGMAIWENRSREYRGELVTDYIGPKMQRISPEDIVFNPLATNIKNTPIITRAVKTEGEIKKMAEYRPEFVKWGELLERRKNIRKYMSGMSRDDFNKAAQYSVDGFGNLFEYYQTSIIEILTFYGDYYDQSTGELHTNRVITIADRSFVISDEESTTYTGKPPISHAGWRLRPDNLWAMGPLDNLVGMQYRLDHLENAKADAFDLIVQPPLVIRGDVEPFVWGPNAEIHIDADGSVEEVSRSLNAVITADSQIEQLENRMELFAGAPREAAGIRSPGEKTAFEVQALENAAGRIFQSKIVSFEIEFLEPLLNDMLELAHQNFDGSVELATKDDDYGVKEFLTVTKEDISAKGVLRPVGARHYAQRAQELQNFVGILNSPVGQKINSHVSGINLAKWIENTLDIRGYDIFSPNIAIMEERETQGLIGQAQEDLAMQAQVPDENQMGVG
jgi:hypothetical protein